MSVDIWWFDINDSHRLHHLCQLSRPAVAGNNEARARRLASHSWSLSTSWRCRSSDTQRFAGRSWRDAGVDER